MSVASDRQFLPRTDGEGQVCNAMDALAADALQYMSSPWRRHLTARDRMAGPVPDGD